MLWMNYCSSHLWLLGFFNHFIEIALKKATQKYFVEQKHMKKKNNCKMTWYFFL